MTKSVRLLLMGAALTGFTAGQNAFAQDTAKPDSTAKTDSGTKTSKAKVEKHACKGQNSCKGNGGCGATKGKNDCKGKGGCATDGSKMPKADALQHRHQLRNNFALEAKRGPAGSFSAGPLFCIFRGIH